MRNIFLGMFEAFKFFVHVCDNNVLVSFVPVQPIYTIIQVTGETSSSLGEGGAIRQITDLCFSTLMYRIPELLIDVSG